MMTREILPGTNFNKHALKNHSWNRQCKQKWDSPWRIPLWRFTHLIDMISQSYHNMMNCTLLCGSRGMWILSCSLQHAIALFPRWVLASFSELIKDVLRTDTWYYCSFPLLVKIWTRYTHQDVIPLPTERKWLELFAFILNSHCRQDRAKRHTMFYSGTLDVGDYCWELRLFSTSISFFLLQQPLVLSTRNYVITRTR